MRIAGPLRLAHVATVDVTLRFLLLSQMKAAQRAGFEVAAVSSPGPWTADLEREGIRHYALPALGRHWDPLGDLRALAALTRLFRREQFALVHTHAPKTGVLGRLAAGIAGTPAVVNTVHGLYGIDPERPARRWFYLSLERLAARGSDFELCQSREDLDLLTRLRIVRPERSAYLGNGVDLERFTPASVRPEDAAALRRELGVPADAPVVGTVGRLVLEKGYREFLTAAEAILRLRPHVRVLVVGPPDAGKADALPEEMIEQARRRGVLFVGMRQDMPELYRLMDVFVLASYREGFPRSAIEAAAMGRPLVLTDIRGCREVVTDGVTGLLVPVRDAGALAAAVLRLLDDAALARRLGAAARARALAEFDEARVIARVLDTYRLILNGRDGATAQTVGA